jgi:hypothetical protein
MKTTTPSREFCYESFGSASPRWSVDLGHDGPIVEWPHDESQEGEAAMNLPCPYLNTDLSPSGRHWIVTAYVARQLSGGTVLWKRP